MNVGELPQGALALVGEAKQYASSVGGVVRSVDQLGQLTAVREFNDGVMPKAHRLGYVAYRYLSAVRSTGNLEQQLVLLWLETGSIGSLLAKQEESANFSPEVS